MAPELMLDLARKAAKLVVERIENLPGEHAWDGEFRQGLVDQLMENPPEAGQPAMQVIERAAREILPLPVRNDHPRFLGFIPSSPTWPGVVADFMAAGYHVNQCTWLTGNDNKELWCGVEPAALFRSQDAGDSWEMVSAISNHEHTHQWQPGNGGLCLHTILCADNRVHLGISTGGHYVSQDGGETFAASNRGIGAGFLPDPYPEFGQCVHKIASHPDAPGRLYMQNHGGCPDHPGIGVLRSDDYGDTWRSIADGLPSDFGLPIVAHPHDPDTIYVVPLEGMTRTCPGGAPAAWRSENGGGSWKRLGKGLPKQQSFFTVLRDAMAMDDLASPALYFGTTTGQLWIGRDGGEDWSCVFDSLPPINCVKVALV